MVALLHNQYAQQISLMNDRRSEKGIKRFLAEAFYPLELRVGTRVIEVERLFPRRDPAHETLIEGQSKLTDLVFVQALRRAKNQFLRRLIVEINSAHVGLHRGPDLRHDQHQRIFQRIGRIHVLDKTSKHLEHYRLLLRRPGFRDFGASEPVSCVSACR